MARMFVTRGQGRPLPAIAALLAAVAVSLWGAPARGDDAPARGAATQADPAPASADGARADSLAVERVYPAPDSSLMARVRKGGFVIVFRHGITDWGERDAEINRFEDRSTQRNLNEQGRTQAKEIGEAFRAFGIPMGRILASPMWRCRDTADLAFGRCDTTIDLFRRSPQSREARRAMLSTPPDSATNTVLVTHQDVLLPLIQGLRREHLREGDAFIVAPGGNGAFEVVAQATPGDWARFAGTEVTLDQAPSAASGSGGRGR